MSTIKKPYNIALKMPLRLLCAPFVKKETVKGIIGKTQGVNKASNPPTKPKRKILNSELPDSAAVLFPVSNMAVFFKSNFSFLVKLLLLSLKRMSSLSQLFPV